MVGVMDFFVGSEGGEDFVEVLAGDVADVYAAEF